MTGTQRPARLTNDEVAAVLRRASEIDTGRGRPDEDGRIDARAVEEAAGEVGLSPVAVRQAIAELRAGVLPEPQPRGARLAASRVVTEQRLVERPVDEVHATIERFLRTQMLDLRRRSADRAVYRPRSDLVASLRRGLDFAGTIKLDGIRTVSVVVTPADDRLTLVRIDAELTSGRAGIVGGASAAGATVALLTGGAGAALGEPALVAAAVPAGAGVGAGGLWIAGARWQRRRQDVADVLAHLLHGL
ncbi:MAG TPA: hypothetical protein VFZ68_12720 [Acidimicrobiales bacterium]